MAKKNALKIKTLTLSWKHMTAITISNTKIGTEYPPFIVAEISANHNQSLERALQIVDAAKAAGAHAVKLQTYTADTITMNVQRNEFLISDKKSLWCGKTLYELYLEAYTPWEWHKPIFERCQKHGLIAFSTPFDESSVDFLEKLNVPCYKIASLEITYLDLIKKAASTGKPLIISTGTASLAEIDDAVAAARQSGCKDIVLLKCTSAYPASAEASNLLTLPHLAEGFGTVVGLSDHTPGIGVAIASIPLGARLIEKHFTLSRADGGLDSAFSLEPQELSALVVESGNAWRALGGVCYGPTESEKTTFLHRRSLYFSQDIPAGGIATKDNVRVIRPGLGLPPKEYEHILGLKLKHSVKRGDPVSWENFRYDEN